MSGVGAVAGYAAPFPGPKRKKPKPIYPGGKFVQEFNSVFRTPDIVGSEKKKKKYDEDFITEEEELVNEVVDYLLGISVG